LERGEPMRLGFGFGFARSVPQLFLTSHPVGGGCPGSEVAFDASAIRLVSKKAGGHSEDEDDGDDNGFIHRAMGIEYGGVL